MLAFCHLLAATLWKLSQKPLPKTNLTHFSSKQQTPKPRLHLVRGILWHCRAREAELGEGVG